MDSHCLRLFVVNWIVWLFRKPVCRGVTGETPPTMTSQQLRLYPSGFRQNSDIPGNHKIGSGNMKLSCQLAVLFTAWFLIVAPTEAKRKGKKDRRGGKKYKKPRGSETCSAGLVQVRSTRSFDETYNLLVSMITDSPDVFVAQEFDAVKVAELANVTGLPPNRVVIFGNTDLSTPLLQSDPASGLDLPQKMHVYQSIEDGQVYVGYNAPTTYLDRRYAWMDDTTPDTLDTIRIALRSLAANAAGVDATTIQDETQTEKSSKRLLHRRPGVYTHASEVDFATTVQRLQAAIPANEFLLINKIDHQANAEAKGLSLDPSTLFLFCFPPFDGTMMQSNQCAVADFPLKLLVTADADGSNVEVHVNSFAYLRKRHRIRKGSISETVFNHVHSTVVDMLNSATAQ